MIHGKLMGVLALLVAWSTIASADNVEYLVKLRTQSPTDTLDVLSRLDGKVDLVSSEGRLFKWSTSTEVDAADVLNTPAVEYFQKNHPIKLFANPSIEKNRQAILEALEEGELPIPGGLGAAPQDNPEIQSPVQQSAGADPLLNNAWGLANVGATNSWSHSPAGKGVIVAVTDTGVDYNHEDLINNMWRNPKEIPGDGIDNDNNGYVDDVVGWDFATNDNKPYDLTVDLFQILLGGGNPGHGTHCAGVVGADHNNGKGASGVAPDAQIMALRFINEKGQGDTASAVQVVDYAVKNGAKIISASWGSEGEEAGDMALREAIQRAQAAGVLFVAAAGNGRQGKGYDNDADAKPVYPSSYQYDNVISVAAIDSENNLAAFSNWGRNSVDVGAPGVKILSTVPGNKYQDTVIDLGEFLHATWDGTSMATPHVAGAFAATLSKNPGLSWQELKRTVLSGTASASALAGKVSTGGKLNLNFLANN
ncbi:MAG: S8 family serine peptidase [Bdellovibrionaceae bacterium]|nr:S8 family serine peptidase [Bdellovibrionales bacterium]MCB9253352.1 S8 family serine peptidase [Pseudobdellovibrionaceae bacterium]